MLVESERSLVCIQIHLFKSRIRLIRLTHQLDRDAVPDHDHGDITQIGDLRRFAKGHFAYFCFYRVDNGRVKFLYSCELLATLGGKYSAIGLSIGNYACKERNKLIRKTLKGLFGPEYICSADSRMDLG